MLAFRDSQTTTAFKINHSFLMPINPLQCHAAYFAQNQYAGYGARIGAVFIDVFVLLILGAIVQVVGFAVTGVEPANQTSSAPDVAWYFLCWLYMVPLKRSSVGTVGYRILGLRIVSTSGTPASNAQLTFRLLLQLFGPFHFVLDLAWRSADPEGQSLIDCFSRTYLVQNSARPLGYAPQTTAFFTAFCLVLFYPRVGRPEEQDYRPGQPHLH